MDAADPMANALAAWCHQQRHLMEWPAAQEEDRETARRMARAVISSGSELPLALALAGAVRAGLTRDHDLALAAVDRAMMINTNTAAALGFAALTRCICGVYDTAVEHAQCSSARWSRLSITRLWLSPWFPFSPAKTKKRVAHARAAIEGNRNFALPYCVLALACARLGRSEEAVQAVRRLTSMAPGFRVASLRKIRFADATGLESDLDLDLFQKIDQSARGRG